MGQKELYFIFLAVLVISTVGCGNYSQPPVRKTGEYQAVLMKSNQNIITKKYDGEEKELTLPELLAKSNTRFKTDMRGDKEVFTELDGVVATAEKSWNVYIDESKKDYDSLNDIKINSKNDIKIIYE